MSNKYCLNSCVTKSQYVCLSLEAINTLTNEKFCAYRLVLPTANNKLRVVSFDNWDNLNDFVESKADELQHDLELCVVNINDEFDEYKVLNEDESVAFRATVAKTDDGRPYLNCIMQDPYSPITVLGESDPTDND